MGLGLGSGLGLGLESGSGLGLGVEDGLLGLESDASQAELHRRGDLVRVRVEVRVRGKG